MQLQLQITALVAALAGATLVSLAAAAAAWRRRAAPGAAALAAMLAAVSWWELASTLAAMATHLDVKVGLAKAQYIGILAVPVLWLVFALQYAYADRRLTRRLAPWLCAFPVATLLAAFSNDWHHLLWRDIQLTDGPFGVRAVFSYGPWFWAAAAYSYALLLAGAILLVRRMLRFPPAYRGQSLLVVCGVALPWLANLAYLAKLVPVPGLDITPFGLTLSAAVLLLGLYRMRFLDLVPVARDVVVEGMRDGVLVLDERLRLLDANPAAHRLLQLPHGGLGLPLEHLAPDWTQLADVFQASGEGSPLVMRVGDADLALQASRLANRLGRPGGWVLVARDVTEREQQRRQRESLLHTAVGLAEARSRLVATVSHDLRTPLSGIVGMSDLLLNTELTGRQREYVESLRRASLGLITLASDVLDATRMSAGALTLETAELDVRALLEDAVAVVAASARAKGLELVTFVQPSIPATLLGDGTRLRQVLVNLLGNAVKFTEQGDVVVRVERRIADGMDADPAAVTLHVSVTDSGIGIPREAQTRLFQPYTQVGGQLSARLGGTGLGLSIARQLVELMGGQIGVHSESGHGSTFWFHLTLKLPPGPRADAQPTLAPLSGKHVLVVDDNAASRMALAELVQAWGGQAEAVGREPDALAAWNTRHEGFDLLLLDAEMPAMPGLEMARRIRATAHGAAVPMVLLEPYDEDLAAPAAEVGVQALCSKPVQPSALLQAITCALAQASASDNPAQPDAPGLAGAGRVLVAEDTHINQLVIRELLAQLGYQAEVVDNGQAAVEAARHGQYAAALLDLHMPVLTGYQAAAEIRRQEGETGAARLPIIALTADESAEEHARCLEAGIDAVLRKPLMTEALRTALRRWARQTQALAIQH